MREDKIICALGAILPRETRTKKKQRKSSLLYADCTNRSLWRLRRLDRGEGFVSILVVMDVRGFRVIAFEVRLE